jgi:melanoma-associated antigen p97
LILLVSGKFYGLVPIVAEDYGPPTGVNYYAVAVARKDTNITILNMKGKKSCHTGYRRLAGWNIPIGYLLERTMARLGCGSLSNAQSTSRFFSESCVPGKKIKTK